MKKRLLLAAALAAASTALLPLHASAQADAWPQQKPVTIIVPFPAGGSTDMVARAIALQMQTKLGGSFVVDNRPGATGTIGTGFVKRAAPDGYTLLVSSLGDDAQRLRSLEIVRPSLESVFLGLTGRRWASA